MFMCHFPCTTFPLSLRYAYVLAPSVIQPQHGSGAKHVHLRLFPPIVPGFDGNNEGDEYSAAQFLVDEMGRFGSYKGRAM